MAYTPVKNPIISELNSSVGPILSNQEFTGTWEEAFEYFGDITVTYNLTDGSPPTPAVILLEFSQDGVSVIKTYSETITEWTTDGKVISSKAIARYFRVRLQNQSASTMTLALQTIYTNSSKQIRTDPNEGLNPNEDIVVTKSFLAMTEQNGDISYPSSRVGNLKVDFASPLSGFGEIMTVTPTPISQFSFVYGINDLLLYEETYLAPAIDSQGNEARVRSGSTSGAFSILRSKIPLHYRPGQASEGRFTARFTNNAANTTSMAGVGNPECGYYFGYNGTSFGIFHLNGGRQEIHLLTSIITPSQGGSITITLDGSTSGPIAVLQADNEAAIARKIAAQDFSSLGYGWDAYAISDSVYFVSRTARDAVLTFSLNPGSTGTGATFTQQLAGQSPTQTFIPQSGWNADPMDGTGPSGMTLAPENGNVYSIVAQYLGFGAIFFSIEDSQSGRFFPVHTIRYANQNTVTNLNNPAVYLTWYVKNSGSPTNIDLRGASGATFVHGQLVRNGLRFTVLGSNSNVSTPITPLLSIRTGKILNGKVAHGQIQLDYVSVGATTGTKPVRVYIYKDATLGGSTEFQSVDSVKSLAEVDSFSTTVTGGTALHSFVVPRDGSVSVSLKDLNINCESGEVITFAAITAVAADIYTSVTWSELQ